MNATRNHVREKFAETLGLTTDHPIPFNMEKSVYNWAIRRSKQLNDPASWESQTFRDRYKLRYSSIIFNLQTSEQFRKKVLDEDIKSSTIALMTSTGMQPEGVRGKCGTLADGG